jgi:hypothetical protein
VARIASALPFVPSAFAAQRSQLIAAAKASAMRHSELATYWSARKGARARASALENERKRSLLEWQRHQLKSNTWGWKLLTLSPQWDPSMEPTVATMRARVKALWVQWDAVWQRLACAGGGAAIASIELSSGGHIHLHALVWAPYIKSSFLRTVAGCFVDLRAVSASPKLVHRKGPQAAVESALREAVKYACKAPRTSLEWVRGDHARVTHPALAARWATAMHGRQLGRVFGLFRDALRAIPAPKPAEKPQQHTAQCCHCEAPLSTCRVLSLKKAVKRWKGCIRDDTDWRKVQWVRARLSTVLESDTVLA